MRVKFTADRIPGRSAKRTEAVRSAVSAPNNGRVLIASLTFIVLNFIAVPNLFLFVQSSPDSSSLYFSGRTQSVGFVISSAGLAAQDRTPYGQSENDFLFIRMTSLNWNSAALTSSYQMDETRLFNDLIAGKTQTHLGVDPDGLNGTEVTVGYRWDEFPGNIIHLLSLSRFDANTAKTEFSNLLETGTTTGGTVSTFTNTIGRTDAIGSSSVERVALRYHVDFLLLKDFEWVRKMTGPIYPFLEPLGVRIGADVVSETITHNGVRIEQMNLTSSATTLTGTTSIQDPTILKHEFKESNWNAVAGLTYRYTFMDRFTVDVAFLNLEGRGNGESKQQLLGPYSVAGSLGYTTQSIYTQDSKQKFEVLISGRITEAGLTVKLFGPLSFRLGYEIQNFNHKLKNFESASGFPLGRMTLLSSTNLLVDSIVGSLGSEGLATESHETSKRLVFELQYRIPDYPGNARVSTAKSGN